MFHFKYQLNLKRYFPNFRYWNCYLIRTTLISNAVDIKKNLQLADSEGGENHFISPLCLTVFIHDFCKIGPTNIWFKPNVSRNLVI